MRNQAKSIEEQDEMKCPLIKLLEKKTDMLFMPEWVDLTITFVDLSSGNGNMLQNVPTVRVIFK